MGVATNLGEETVLLGILLDMLGRTFFSFTCLNLKQTSGVCVCFRLCSLAQDAKQEAEDPTVSKEIIKPDPATGEEEQQEETDVKVSISRDEEEAQVDADSSSGLSPLLMCLMKRIVSPVLPQFKTFLVCIRRRRMQI